MFIFDFRIKKPFPLEGQNIILNFNRAILFFNAGQLRLQDKTVGRFININWRPPVIKTDVVVQLARDAEGLVKNSIDTIL